MLPPAPGPALLIWLVKRGHEKPGNLDFSRFPGHLWS